MTVMPSVSDVADKAVSTEDASSGGEVVRLEAVLAALVETKVEAMKASSALNANKRPGSAPPSPRRARLTSSSTASSSQNHHHHNQHQHRENDRNGNCGEQRQQHRRENNRHVHEAKKREAHRHRRHDSAPCGDYIQDPTSRDHRKQRSGKTRRRASEMPPPSPRKKRRHSKSPNVPRDVNLALDSRFELLDIDGDQDLALINFERTREALGESCDYPGIHQSACYFSPSAAHLKIHYDQDDYVALNLDDEFEDEESLNGRVKSDDKRERYHRPRRKRKRKRRIVEPDVPEEEYVDPEELPPRARWTIVATACLLLAMSLLLVGVTLRMAPIIDDMVRKENEELMNSLNRDNSVPENSTAAL